MTLRKRLLIYAILFILYWLLSFVILPYGSVFGDIVNTITFCYLIFNVVIAFLFIRKNVVVKLISAAVTTFVSLFVVFMMLSLGLYYKSTDPYGVVAAITFNAIFSIICWEIMVRIETRFSTL